MQLLQNLMTIPFIGTWDKRLPNWINSEVIETYKFFTSLESSILLLLIMGHWQSKLKVQNTSPLEHRDKFP